MTNRWDETWHRLREWTNGQAPSERLAAQILWSEGYASLDPSHPLGGPDAAKDAVCVKDHKTWLMAAYFPKGQKRFATIRKKFLNDLRGVRTNKAEGFAFITNQELSLAQRADLKKAAKKVSTELYHLERVATILDKPSMSGVRKQFLGIETDEGAVVDALKKELDSLQRHLASLQTGGDTFCYWMLYHFDLTKQIAQNFCIIRRGEYPLYGVHIRITDMDAGREIFTRDFGEVNAPVVFLMLKWPLPEATYYRAFFQARNGGWHQDLVLRRSTPAGCWLAASRVVGSKGEVRFEHMDKEFLNEFVEPTWRS